MKEKYSITGMTCGACSAHVEKSVRKLKGIRSVSVNLLQNSALVDFDETVVSSADIIKAVESGGYGAFPVSGRETVKGRENPMAQEIRDLRLRLIVSALFLIPLLYLSMGDMIAFRLPEIFRGAANAMTLAFTQFLLTLPVLYVNRKFFIVGFKALAHKAPNMDSLVAIGTTAAMLYGVSRLYGIGYGLGYGDTELAGRFVMDLYFESAATILTLVTVGKYLEARSKGKTSSAIAHMLDLAPKTAVVIRQGAETEISALEVVPGDTVVVKAGGKIPVDGIITEGAATVDESAMTGESLPVDKVPGDKVTGATMALSGYFRFRAVNVGGDTTLAKIVALVQDANSTKAPIAKLADRVSGVFVPVVISIALLAVVVWLLAGYPVSFALSAGIAVLVISCPCALGLATPTAIMVGTGKGAELGIFIKSAESLEIAHKIDTVVLDKTGTVTQGEPEITDIIPAEGVSSGELLSLAASLEKLSEHPLARAIVSAAAQKNVKLYPVEDFLAIPGRGVQGKVNGSPLYAGNLFMMQESGILCGDFPAREERLAEQGKTSLYISVEDRLLGVLALADTVKPTSGQAIQDFKKMGIEVVMLTGDNRRTAGAIGRQVGIDRIVSELLPQDKEAEIRRIQAEGKKVAMIGDGINDAPALARADVGIAIGAGTDIAVESADIVLMRSDPADAVTAVQLSRAVIRNIKQNLFWAFFYNLLGIPLAAGVFYSALGWKLNPMFAAAAMSISSVCVVTNALRLKFFKPEREARVALTEKTTVPGKEESSMMKIMTVEGMFCGHCAGRVEKALNSIPGVQAVVDLAARTATLTLTDNVPDDMLKKAVEDAGYTVVGIK